MNRRQFIGMTTAASLCAAVGCPMVAAQSNSGGVIDAGPVHQFDKEGIYDNYRSLGFFVIRRSGELIAFSSICPHRHVQLKAEPDGSFYCPRHGSTFSSSGQVKKGPASRNLAQLTTSVNSAGHLLVHV
jgi:Rieske Fe-S protein